MTENEETGEEAVPRRQHNQSTDKTEAINHKHSTPRPEETNFKRKRFFSLKLDFNSYTYNYISCMNV